MANNRVYLLHVPSGRFMRLGKYYPSTGWHAGDVRMQDFFDLNAATDMEAFGSEGETYRIAYEGDGLDWSLEYFPERHRV